MKIQFMSDLHLEFSENREYFSDNPLPVNGDVLVLAGDIVCDSDIELARPFYDDIAQKFPLIINTMGNHEFYHGTINYAYPDFQEKISDNHLRINNQTIVHDNHRFIVSTLWSEIDPLHQLEIHRRLQDYRYISKDTDTGKRPLMPEDSMEYHKISRNFIESELKKAFDGKTVIVTHHIPTISSVIPKWRTANILSAFANKLDHWFEKYDIDLWIFGHQHEQVDFMINKTRIVSNPLGYAKEPSFQLFRPDAFVVI